MKKKVDVRQVSFRLEASLLRRLDEHVARLRTANPGMKISRESALRSLLHSELPKVEKLDG